MTLKTDPFHRPFRRASVCGTVFLFLFSGATIGAGRQEAKPVSPGERPEGFELLKKTTHSGTAPWTDTGIEVKAGEEFYFEAEGTVSLQKDNPVAVCGPEGLNLRTMQQPVTDQNLGCLIGRVVERTEVTVDKDRGEKTVRFFGPTFFIGPQAQVVMPSSGRLLLGVNENVTKDNDGEFAVSIYKKR